LVSKDLEMAEPPSPPVDDENGQEAADASWLIAGTPPAASAPVQSQPGSPGQPGGEYDVGPPAEDIVVSASPLDAEPAKPRKPTAGPEPRTRPMFEPSEAVEQVWSRSAEWGLTITVVAVVAVVLFIVLYSLVANELFGPAVIVLIAGGLGLAFLAYPMLITLERPVRMTPEQALNDFYGALAHHFPHYRRMWLLLSTAGRTSGSFATFEGFSKYWTDRLGQLRGERVGSFTPLKFQVAEFKSEKSAGVSEISVQFKLEVSARGQTAQGPIATIPMQMDLVRGPDRMWYLCKGTLPSV
jgi:hypothetical protein